MKTCIGKYLQLSGFENILIETRLFEECVVDQILSGNHYVICTKAFRYSFESLKRLQSKELLYDKKEKKCETEFIDIILLKESLNNFEECKYIFKELNNHHIKSVLQDFNDFILKRSQESELFKYWNNVCILIISLMLDLVRERRTRNWRLHLQTVEKCLRIFLILDRLNYTRWCSWYLEDMYLFKEISMNFSRVPL